MRTFWLVSNCIKGVQSREVLLYHNLLEWRRTSDKNIIEMKGVSKINTQYSHTMVQPYNICTCIIHCSLCHTLL